MLLAKSILAAAGLYAGIGVLVAIAFVLMGIARAYPKAGPVTYPARILILPAAAGLWPLIIWRSRGGSR